MRASRCFPIWATLAVCAALVLGAMTWLTRSVLAAEKDRSEAESRADLEERTRLALWRMDGVGASIVLGENLHPPADFDPAATVFSDEREPLLKLHFEVTPHGGITTAKGRTNYVMHGELLDQLKASPMPKDEWSMLYQAARTGEAAWQALPKVAAQSQADNLAIRQQKGTQQSRGDQSYQSNSNGNEFAQRAKTMDETYTNSLVGDPPTGSSAGGITSLAVMRPVRIGDQLFLLRQVTATRNETPESRLQGVWLDAELLKQKLLAEIRDLLPDAELVPTLHPSATDPLALVSFPFLLRRNETIPPFSAGANAALIVGWGAVGFAILTTSLLIHGVMRLSDRRASFVSAVTHELRTPLTTFRLYSDMLESGVVKPHKQREYLKVLSREADRLSHLVENVLSFSRIERGNARSVIRETTIPLLLEPLRERFEARLATAEMTLQMDLHDNRSIRVDTAAVEHILFNLVDNSAKYAASGNPPQVTIEVIIADPHLEIIVADRGPGIPLADRERIFRAFHKSAREAAESRPGVGLGLALSRRLAKSLGGSLICKDVPLGACFILRLPLT